MVSQKCKISPQPSLKKKKKKDLFEPNKSSQLANGHYLKVTA